MCKSDTKGVQSFWNDPHGCTELMTGRGIGVYKHEDGGVSVMEDLDDGEVAQ